MSYTDRVYTITKNVAKSVRDRSNLSDRFKFESRSNAASGVVIVLAGYKQPLWPFVFPRLVAAVPEGFDVCVMSAAKYDKTLSELCQAHKWSYLSTATNDVALIQNIAINLHPCAQKIIKMDEDIFVTSSTLVDLLAYAESVRARGIFNPSIISPLINVNGFCYRRILEKMGLLEEYESIFGTAAIATLGIKATDDAEAAKWLWRRTTPLEQFAEIMRSRPAVDLLSPVQFSIGLFLMEREFWQEIGYFQVRRLRIAFKKNTLGGDEEFLCRQAMFNARPISVCESAVAGHFSFGRQYKGMLDLLAAEPEMFNV